MADIIVAQLQNLRGDRKDLPQSLLPGEIGFCIDTSQVFIGADGNDDPNSVVTLTAQLYDVNDLALANTYLSSHIYAIDPIDPDIPFDPVQLKIETDYDYFCITSRTILEFPNNTKSGTEIERAYIGYDDSQTPSPPTTPQGTVQPVSDITLFVAPNDFFDPLLGAGDVTDPNVDEFFTAGDSGCISELLNRVHGVTGLTNTLQNIEVQTVQSKVLLTPPTSVLIDTLEKDIITFDYPPITGVTIDYSLFSEADDYSRTGRIKISVADITEFDNIFVESEGTTASEIFFTTESTGTDPVQIVLKAKANNFLDTEMTYRIVRWNAIIESI